MLAKRSDIFNVAGAQQGDAFQVLQLDEDEASRNAPNRKRRVFGEDAPPEVPQTVGKLEEVAMQMESFLVYRPVNSQNTFRARDELVNLTRICKSQSGAVDQLRQVRLIIFWFPFLNFFLAASIFFVSKCWA